MDVLRIFFLAPGRPHRPRRLPPTLRPALVLALCVALLLAGCQRKEEARGAMTDDQASAESAPAAAAPEPNRSGAQTPVGRTAVEVLRLQPQDFTVRATYIGHLLPRERVELRSEIDGVVEKVAFDEGQQVSNGELLVNISTGQLRVRRDQARADLQLAESVYTRDQELNTKRLVPDAQLDQSRTRRDLARYALQLAEIELRKSQVTSPIAGTVKTRAVNVGEFINKGQPIAEILDVSRVRALVNVPERDVRFLAPGRKVSVDFEALPTDQFAGVVTLVGLEADVKTRTFPVEVEVNNREGRLRPGMLARVNMALQSYQDQLLIPRHAILEREQGRVVYVVADGRAEERQIVIGASSGGQVQVLQGLHAGEQLIVTGQQKLTPREPVQVRAAE